MLIRARGQQRLLLLALGAVLGLMNVVFYLAIDRLPLSTVGAIEFLGPVLLAAVGVRTWRKPRRAPVRDGRGGVADRSAPGG
ncbi:hypothetical protein [Fodinicola feengrottensis]|uniref:hypothetical protein n=1 Tax=Fodinicola feengrottensis TaxID=435914 RepID=UPI00244232EE|nr:hypothetical protein [Fodinicola feengrottensis]